MSQRVCGGGKATARHAAWPPNCAQNRGNRSSTVPKNGATTASPESQSHSASPGRVPRVPKNWVLATRGMHHPTWRMPGRAHGPCPLLQHRQPPQDAWRGSREEPIFFFLGKTGWRPRAERGLRGGMWPKELARSHQHSADAFRAGKGHAAPPSTRPWGDRAGKGISDGAGGAVERPAARGQAPIAGNAAARPRLSPKSFPLLALAALLEAPLARQSLCSSLGATRKRCPKGTRDPKISTTAEWPTPARYGTVPSASRTQPFWQQHSQNPKSGIL